MSEKVLDNTTLTAEQSARESVKYHDWQPIKTAPKGGSFVLLHIPGGALESGPVTMGAYFRMDDRDERGWFKKGVMFPADWTGWLGTDGDGSPSWCDPTHWMPLPEPPTDK